MSKDRQQQDLPDDPDAPPSDKEQRLARELAEAVELDGPPGAGPPGDAPSDDELAEALSTAAMIRASVGDAAGLPRDQRDGLLDEVLSASARDTVGGETARVKAQVTPLRRFAPLIALAATVVLVIGAVIAGLPLADRHAGPGAAPPPAWTLSRPSNELLGKPIADKDRAGASRRLDQVFANRLAGYRHLTLAGERGAR